jgi:hypothetical protein
MQKMAQYMEIADMANHWILLAGRCAVSFYLVCPGIY